MKSNETLSMLLKFESNEFIETFINILYSLYANKTLNKRFTNIIIITQLLEAAVCKWHLPSHPHLSPRIVPPDRELQTNRILRIWISS